MWYLKDDSPIPFHDFVRTFKLLVLKHFGSIVGGSFVNSFLLVPDMMNDIFCGSEGDKKDWCCGNTLDLVRSDAYAYIAVNGTAFCNSAKYCEYLCNETMCTDNTQSSMRIYRVGAHIVITTFASIAALLFKGSIEPYFIIITLVFGVFISTFFISYHADAAEALQIMFLMSEEFTKRNDTVKKATNILHRRDRNHFIDKSVNVDERHNELANEIMEARKANWRHLEPVPK